MAAGAPTGIIDILDQSLRLYRAHFVPAIKVAAVVLVPGYLIMAIVLQSALGPLFQAVHGVNGDSNRLATIFTEFGTPELLMGGVVAACVLLMVYGILFPIANGALYVTFDIAARGQSIEVGAVYRKVMDVLWAYVGAVFIKGMFIGLGFMLFIFPGVWAMLVFSQVEAVALLEGRSANKCLSRSRELMSASGSKGRIFVLTILVGIFGILVNQSLELSYTLAIGDSPDAFLVSILLQGLGQLLLFPLTAAVMVTFFHDLKADESGLDLEVEAARLGLEFRPPGGRTFIP